MNPSYNNSFGGLSATPQINPMVGGGDVVLSSSTSKNNTKKWVVLIVLIITAILLVGLGVWLFVPKIVENLGATGALNRYGEYLSKYEEKSSSQYYAELKGLYDEFLKEAESDEKFKDKMAELRKVPDFIDKVAQIDKFESLGKEDVLNKYISDGYDVAQKLVSGFYQFEGSDEKMFDYQVKKKFYFSVYLDTLKAYDENGCIVGGKMDDMCIKRVEKNDSLLVGMIRESVKAEEECQEYVKVMRGSLLSSYEEIKEMVK